MPARDYSDLGGEAQTELDPGGASKDPRRLGRLLPAVRAHPALLPRGRERALRRVSAMRRPGAASLSVLQRTDPVRVRGRVRGVRRRGQAGRALRHGDPQVRSLTGRNAWRPEGDSLAREAHSARAVREQEGGGSRGNHGSPALRAGDLREADHGDDVVLRDLAVVELPEEVGELVGAAELRVVVLDLAG